MSGANPIGLTVLKRRVTGSVDADTGIKKLRSIVIDEAKRKHWQFQRIKTIKLLSDLCLTEYANQAKCKICEGTQFVDGQECPKCRGKGYSEHKMTSRAVFLEVSRTTYYKTWEKRRAHIELLFNELLPDYEYYAQRHIYKLLKNNTIE